jgi:hypothetical protein
MKNHSEKYGKTKETLPLERRDTFDNTSHKLGGS